jgi:hypothetical protein
MKNIYLISSIVNDQIMYKVGYTKRKVEDRIKEFKTGNPGDFNIVEVYEAKNFGVSIEKNLHNKYKDKKINGEWFMLEKEDIETFMEDCEKLYKRYKFIQENNTYLEDRNIYLK